MRESAFLKFNALDAVKQAPGVGKHCAEDGHEAGEFSLEDATDNHGYVCVCLPKAETPTDFRPIYVTGKCYEECWWAVCRSNRERVCNLIGGPSARTKELCWKVNVCESRIEFAAEHVDGIFIR